MEIELVEKHETNKIDKEEKEAMKLFGLEEEK